MRIVRRVSTAVGVALLVGCYTLQPTSAAPTPGTEIALDINDVGRVALGGPMGPSVRQVEGRLVSKDTNEYVLAVTDVHTLDGGDQVWRGEPVHIKSEYVSATYRRKLSVARSVAQCCCLAPPAVRPMDFTSASARSACSVRMGIFTAPTVGAICAV